MHNQDQKSEAITCSQLVEQIAMRQDRLMQKDIKLAVKLSFDYISRALSLGDRVEIRGFGSFSLRFKKPKIMHNPVTKEAIQISGRNLPFFKPSNLLNQRLNRKVHASPALASESIHKQNNADKADSTF